MILVDANILVYAHVTESPHHEAARRWFDEQLNGTPRVGLPWASLLAFMRLVTNPRVFERPEPTAEAWATVKEWLSCAPVWIPQPGERHAEILEALLTRPGVVANLIPDAHLAALSIEYGLTICSSDADFARFPSVTWTNPLTASA